MTKSPNRSLVCTAAALLALGLGGCAQLQQGVSALQARINPKPPEMPPFSQDGLPAAVQVPRGFQVALETTGTGQIKYMCRANASGSHAWALAQVTAKLVDRKGKPIIDYTGPPASFAHEDGSTISASALAQVPSSPGNLTFQLFAVDKVNKLGTLMGMTHIQRVATVGGVAPAKPCDASFLNASEMVNFQADYIFYRSL
jgi:hypothetical protein